MLRTALIVFLLVGLSGGCDPGRAEAAEAPQSPGEPALEIPTSQLRPGQRTAGDVGTQDMNPFGPGRWDGDDQLWWTGGKPGDEFTVEFHVAEAGEWLVEVVLTRAPDYGIVQLALDGAVVTGAIDLFNPAVAPTWPIPLGRHQLAAGIHRLSVKITGANELAKGRFLFGIDRIRLFEPTRSADGTGTESARHIEQLYRLDWLPRMHTDYRTEMFSSYDRTGENNDGFSGVYSKLWVEDGNSVLATMRGAGCIQRIWFTHSQHRSPGLLNLQREHIKVFVDGQKDPVIDVPLEDLFAGGLPAFPKPLVGEGQGGYYCYVPIPYRDGCRVVVEGTGVRFYQLTYRSFAPSTNVASFRMTPTSEQERALRRAVQAWTDLGGLQTLDLQDPVLVEVALSLKAGQSKAIALPAGPSMVRAVLVDGAAEALRGLLGAQIRFIWDEEANAAVDLPVEYFFGQALEPPPYRCLLVGVTDRGWYNFMPMPYQTAGAVYVKARLAIDVKMTLVCQPLRKWDGQLGYLHAAYREELPVEDDRYFTFLRRDGGGHYVGTYLVTQGTTDRRLPLWLEGDDRFTVDGRLAIHGTGSEDYFNCGWYAVEGRLNGPGAFPLHGFPVYRLVDERNQAVAFRWHLTDPVYYAKSLVAEMEHGGNNRQAADYRAAAFWYEPR